MVGRRSKRAGPTLQEIFNTLARTWVDRTLASAATGEFSAAVRLRRWNPWLLGTSGDATIIRRWARNKLAGRRLYDWRNVRFNGDCQRLAS